MSIALPGRKLLSSLAADDSRNMVAALPTGARSPGIDPAKLVAEARTNKWREENGRAFIDANAFLDRFGLWSDGKRSF